MIPAAHIYGWQEYAPWSDIAQVEQDLVLSRAIIDLFSQPGARELLAFRGGTALHKLHLSPAARYSEDIDLVQISAGPARPVFDLIRASLDPWLGQPQAKTRRNGLRLLYNFETEISPIRRMRVKVEVNTREHFSELGFVGLPLAVESPWFSGVAEVTTYALDELLGTKLRALYQRKKGRDLFDLWHAFGRGGVDAGTVIRCLRAYLAHQQVSVSAAEFEANLAAKALDPAFEHDVGPLLRSDITFDQPSLPT